MQELTLLQQIAALQSQLSAKQQATLNNTNKSNALSFEAKEKQSTTDLKNFVENEISIAIENARIEILQKFESNDWLETCIDTTLSYISVGVNFNPKAQSNLLDKKLKINCTFRTIDDPTKAAEKKANKDTAKSIKISSHKLKTSFSKSKTDNEKALAKIELENSLERLAKRSGIPYKKTI
jgi:hypothetical protein|tara:strand:+ start:339 stop:881 length:543 start_codon:yes stop_codon:yes gene_type:complete